MNPGDFRRVLTAFADHTDDFRLDRDRLVVQVRDEVIEAGVREQEVEVRVRENGQEFPAYQWLTNRIAKIPQLADRILDHIPEQPFFIPPAGDLLDPLDRQPTATRRPLSNAHDGLTKAISHHPFGRSTVLYLTADAGEGKTTLIDHAARFQAEQYKQRRSSFLLLPIRLAGRAFLSFDDIVIAEFVNRFRFPFFYYDAFLELVKMRVLVPAFDGFEEMFVERSTGEAVSAVGALLRDLESSGTVVIAARRAFFEYADFEIQARLFDTLGAANAGFSQIRLERWDRDRFVRYTRSRGIENPAEIHERVRSRLGEGHPALTRAVLVRRLLDVAERGGVEDLLRRLGTERTDYFYEFVSALVEREAQEKWIDRSGTESSWGPLLSVGEHHTLLAQISMEMWMTSVDAISEDLLDIVVELFAEAHGKTPAVAASVKRRIRDHALVVGVAGRRKNYAFDHDDFRHLYLGEAVAGLLGASDRESELSQVLLAGPLPDLAADAAVNALWRRRGDLHSVGEQMQKLVSRASPISHIPENTGAIMVRLLEKERDRGSRRVVGFEFSSEALRGRHLGRVVFEECVFQGTALDGADLSRCRFERCRFLRLELPRAFAAGGAVLRECRIVCLVRDGESDGIYDPERIERALAGAGFVIERPQTEVPRDARPDDPDARLAQRSLRCFLRATQVAEEVFRHRLGKQKGRFFDSVLPRMLDRGVLRPVEYRGHGQQRRFALAVPMRRIAPALTTSGASLDEFLEALVRKD